MGLEQEVEKVKKILKLKRSCNYAGNYKLYIAIYISLLFINYINRGCGLCTYHKI